MRLLLLDCDLDRDEKNTAAMIVRDLAPMRCDIATYRVCEDEFPPDVRCDAIIVNGSAANVDEEKGWIRRLEHIVRLAHETGIPLLGICFGAQVIAQALGGEVKEMGETEFGYVPIVLVEHALFDGISSEPAVFSYHSYAVTRLPEGAVLLGANDVCVQAFCISSTIGFQFHPEVLPKDARGMAQRAGKEMAALEEQILRREPHAERFVQNFVRFARRP